MVDAADSISALEWLTYDLPNISAALQYSASQVRQGVPPLQSPQTKPQAVLKPQQKKKMAIYHCSAHNISRSSGRTATAAAAYRTATEIQDERTGLTHDYTRKQGVMHTEIFSNLGIPIDRSELWNLAEQAENRSDARTAKEFVIALPHELDQQQRQELARDFARYLVNRYDCIADLAIHAPSNHSEDDRNHHAHIMLTTRKAGLSEQQYLVLKEKIDLELSNAKRKKLGLPATSKEVVQIRQDWERIANSHLERAGRSERIDHRSYEEQGNGKQAQIHETPQVTAMRRKGKQTEISRANDERKAYNAQLEQEQRQEKENRQNALLNNAQNSLQARLAEREAQRAAEQARRAEQERKAQEQAKQVKQQRHGKGITR